MKKLLLKICLVLSIPLLYFIAFSGFKNNEEFKSIALSVSEDPTAKSFINLIFTDTYFGSPLHGNNPNDPRSIENNISNFRDSLHFNSIHVYGYGNLGGGFDDPTSYYDSYINGLITTVNNAGLRGFYGRNKIEQLSYGQRLIYEVGSGNFSRVNSGFSYDSIMSNTYGTDSGRTVLHAIPYPTSGYNSPGWLCKNIYENMQHGDLINFTQADTLEWHIKPVMRINKTDFNASSRIPVVAIVTKNYSGNRIDSVVIRVNNFRNDSNTYWGNYIENYKFEQSFDSLRISGSRELPTGLSYGMTDYWYDWKANCKVDFKVYWFGEVEVWFDKMIVDDHFGDILLNTDTTISHPNERKIKEEAAAFTDNINSGNGSFFIDELCISQLPCVKRVYQLMKEINSNAKLNFATTNYFNIRSCKDNSVAFRDILKTVQSESFNPDIHEFFFQYLPNNLNTSDLDPHIDLNWLKSKEIYNNYLQKKVLGDKSVETGIDTVEGHWGEYTPSNLGSLVYQVEYARSVRDTFSPQTKLIIQPQIHAVLRVGTNGYFENQREPFSKEIQVEAMLSIAHGANGICWFIYHSTPTNFYQSRSTEYAILGLQNNDAPNYTHRHRNLYGQDKWNAVRDMNIKIEHWKPTLDKINWSSGWSVHKDGAGHEFISDIKSIYYDAIPPYDFSPGNDDPVKYWEMGFFDPDFDNPEVSSNDRSKYFIMVNRRCAPDVNNQGDFRQLKIKFDSTQLQGFRNWKIIELDSNNVVRTFDKDSNIYIDVKIFKPGEGILYKLAPVMQEGGTLAANEQVEGITFVCNGPVNNNGKDISILEGTKINFKTGAGITMNGGKLTCSNYSTNTSENVLLKGYNGPWNGIVMNNCMRSVIQRTRFEDAKNCIVINNDNGGSKYTAKVIRKNYFKVTADSGKALTINNQMEMAIDSNTFEITSLKSN